MRKRKCVLYVAEAGVTKYNYYERNIISRASFKSCTLVCNALKNNAQHITTRNWFII